MTKNQTSIVVVLVTIAVLAGVAYAITAITDNDTANPTSTTPTSGTQIPSTNNPSQAGAPVATTNVNTSASQSTAVVTGSVNPNGVQTTYWVEYGTSPTLATPARTASQSIGSGFITIPTPAYITGLAPSKLYYFRLAAQNSLGTGYGQIQSFTTSASLPPPQGTGPSARTLAATEVSRTTANLHGQVNPSGSQASYWFEYGTTSGLGNITTLQSAGNANANSAVVISASNLLPATKYFFRINAQNQFGTVNGEILSFTTSGPAAAKEPVAQTKAATNIATSTVTFNGTVTPNGAETTYWFEYGKDAGLATIIGSTNPLGSVGAGFASVPLSLNAGTLSNNTQYYYRIVASNQFGQARGNIMGFKTKNK